MVAEPISAANRESGRWAASFVLHFLLLVGVASLAPSAIAAGSLVFALSRLTHSVTLIDSATRQPLSPPIPTPGPGDWVAVDPGGERAFLAILCPPPGQPGFGCGPGKLAVLDVSKRAVIDTFDIGPEVSRAVASPDRGVFYFVHEDFGLVTARDMRSGQARSVSIEGAVAATLSPDGQLLYVAAALGRELVVVRAADLTMADRLPLPDRSVELAVTPDGRTLVLLEVDLESTIKSRISLLDLATREMIRRQRERQAGMPILRAGERWLELALLLGKQGRM